MMQSYKEKKFEDALAALMSSQAIVCQGNQKLFGHMIERVAAALGFTIAMASGGDGKTISTMISGAEAYALEEAVNKSEFARLINSAGVLK
jgi:hypothetical protein